MGEDKYYFEANMAEKRRKRKSEERIIVAS